MNELLLPDVSKRFPYENYEEKFEEVLVKEKDIIGYQKGTEGYLIEKINKLLQTYSKEEILKVATKYPHIAKKYFKSRGQNIEIIKLNGSVELAPIVGLSDVIVDLVETGNTLKVNGLEIVEDMCNISSRIIANRVSYKFNKEKIENIVEKFASTLNIENY